jgi:chemotaxis protein CheD
MTPDSGMGGMNHFMLPGGKDPVSLYDEQAGRYGVTAMELLINSLMKHGVDRKKIKAKVFGGGHIVLFPKEKVESCIGQQNIDFVFRYLEAEKIPVIAHDVGGFGGRRVFYFPWDGRVLVSRLKKPEAEDEIRLEEEYYRRIIKKETKPVQLFFNQ